MEIKPIKVLVTSADAVGHVNSALGIASALFKRGNDVYFANRKHHKKSAEKIGLKFIALEDYDDSYSEVKADFFVEIISQHMKKAELTPIERIECWDENDNKMVINSELKLLDIVLRKISNELKPDIIIGDVIFTMPFFITSTIPCIPVFSPSPIGLYTRYGIPAGAGFSVNDSKEVWQNYRKKEEKMMQSLNNEFKDWFSSYGLEAPRIYEFEKSVKFFGIYIYPEFLDYSELGPPPSKWIRMDYSIREPIQNEFSIPKSLTDKPGKLIYLSMGSLGSAHLPLMKKLIETFSKSKHRFIVSKGPRGDEFSLAENMWGENYVNQLAILPKVDLVITHGGNNTTVETLYFGKVMIVMPLFYDQLDNAQRIDDLKLGRRINPFKYNDDELHELVDQLLENNEMKEKISKISEQLKTSKSREKVLDLIEKTARTKKSPFLM